MEQRSDELRLALVLNGGVSLAVWMGGVSFELNRLVRETHPVYRGLLELTSTAARIDVISGTSAGGINGAALALAQMHDRSLYSLRDVWLDTGGMDELLHDPDDPGLNSLLRGNEWFLPQIRKAFADLAQGPRADPAHVPISLTLTTTLLDGEKHVSLDDFGAEIEDKVHRAHWRFPHLPGEDAFTDPQVIEQLAFAARSTASFPVAFEPALYEPQGAAFHGNERLQVQTAPPRKVPHKAYLLDGGILDNQPFQAALEAISRLPAEGNTRRVLAYIVPDPAAQAERRPQTNGVLEQPTLAQAAWRSLVSIPGSQSIASHMAKLREHNDEASARWRRLVGAVVHMRSAGLVTCAGASLAAYKARRVEGVVDHFLEATRRGLAIAIGEAQEAAESAAAGAAGQAPEIPQMRRSTRHWLASTWRATARGVLGNDLGCEHHVALDPLDTTLLPAIDAEWQQRIPATCSFDATVLQGPWTWGRYTLQFMSEFTTELLRRTQRLQALVPRWTRDASQQGQQQKPEVMGPAVPQFEPLASDDQATLLQRVRRAAQQATRLNAGLPRRSRSPADSSPDIAGDRYGDSDARRTLLDRGSRLQEDGKQLEPLWRTAYETAADIRERRMEFDELAQRTGQEGFTRFVSAWRDQGGEQPPLDNALTLLKDLLTKSRDGSDLQALARRICGVVLDLQPYIDTIIDVHGRRGPGRGDIDEAVCELRALQAYLYEPLPGQPWPQDDESRLGLIASRMLALEVFELAAASRRQSPGAQAEIVQISGRLSSAFGGASDPALKLNGMQLAHFGAFYKRSWRANDWTFGCLDGADRAVRMALNPDALQKQYGNRLVKTPDGKVRLASDYVLQYLKALAVDTADNDIHDYLRDLWDKEADALAKELAWLDDEQTVPPPVLEACARALTRRLQLETLRREIPDIAKSLMTEAATGAPPSRQAGAPLLVLVAQGSDKMQPPMPKVAVELVRSNLLGRETLKMQLGTDLLTRTVSQALATTHSAFSSAAGGLNALKALFKVTEWPIRIFHWLANRFAQPSSTSASLEAIAYGAGAAIVLAAGLSEKLPGPVLGFGWALLTGAIATSLLRDRRTGAVLVCALLVLLIALKKATFLLVAGTVGAYLLLLSPFGAGLAALVLIGVAAWWSAGGSADAASLLSNQMSGWPEVAEIKAEAARYKKATGDLDVLHKTLWPALALGVSLVAVAIIRAVDTGYEKLRRLGGGPKD